MKVPVRAVIAKIRGLLVQDIGCDEFARREVKHSQSASRQVELRAGVRVQAFGNCGTVVAVAGCFSPPVFGVQFGDDPELVWLLERDLTAR